MPLVSVDDVGAVVRGALCRAAAAAAARGPPALQVARVALEPAGFANSTLNLVGEWLDGGAIARAFTMASKGVVYEDVDPRVAIEAFAAAGIVKDWAAGTVAALRHYITIAAEDRPKSSIVELGLKPTRFTTVRSTLRPFATCACSPQTFLQFVKTSLAPLL